MPRYSSFGLPLAYPCIIALGLQLPDLLVALQQRFPRLRQLLGEGGKLLKGIRPISNAERDSNPLIYLRQVGVDLALQTIPLLLDIVQLVLRLAEPLLRLPQAVHQLVALVQHGDHQLLEVGILAAELRGALRDAVLRYCGHYVAHHVPHYLVGAARLRERARGRESAIRCPHTHV